MEFLILILPFIITDVTNLGDMAMIDMHSHILFDVDDGARTISDSLELIKEEVKKGVDHIILTPHYKKRLAEEKQGKVLENFILLKDMAKEENLKAELYLGNEVYLDSNYFETIWKESFFTLADSDFILIEFSILDIPKNIPEICYEANLKGYIPIIAHIERYEFLYDNKQLISDILNEGAHFQVNASAVINKESRESYKFVNYLLKNELVSFVASDVHNLGARGFYLDEAYKTVKKLCSEAYAEKIFIENQQNIITNKYFDSPKLEYGKRGILSKLFK